MAFVNIKPGTMLSPVPAVLVSCGAEGKAPNALAVAWAGTVNSEPPMCSVSVRKERYSHDLIAQSGEFVINLCGRANLRALDYCGVRSGRDGDKLSACGLTPVPAEGLTYAPALAECPLFLGCRVRQTLELGSHDMFVGEIVSVGVREDLMGADGRIDLERADLTVYSHGVYYALGDVLGFFGCSVARPEVYKKRMRELKKERR